MELEQWINALGSREPTPGGGGASATLGAVAAALCEMVGNLTSGKARYQEVQPDMDRIVALAKALEQSFLSLAEADAEAFLPLSRLYALPKDAEGREEKLEIALKNAALVPLRILEECEKVAGLCAELAEKGSRLAVSDAGVAAAACEAAAGGAALNVYVNTRLMKNKETAEALNAKAEEWEKTVTASCRETYRKVRNSLAHKGE
ncbi:MAG: cyclodeaminase/cyclohydrolase family protein [Ruminococcus sp.]|nr:cyclodeaminase/cyclohydrolase family protein [Candidatus Apopatosoma intestinale]